MTAVAAPTAHARYARRMAAALEAAATGPFGGPPAPGWMIHAARFRPGAQPWATIVQRGPAPLDVATTLLLDAEAAPDSAIETEAGAAVVRRFPDDDAFPTLGRAVAAVDDAVVVRYRPGSRCMLRAETPQGVRWIKVLAAGIDPQRTTEAADRWWASRAGALDFVVAEPDHADLDVGAEWQLAVPGRPIGPVLRSADGGRLLVGLGAALASLGTARLAPARTARRADQIARLRRGVARVAGAVPKLAEALAAHVRRLECAAADLPVERAVPIHGSPHEHQWLLADDGTLGLVDFDRWARGEPELDAASLLGELFYEDGLGARIPELANALTTGYEEGDLTLDADVLRWYLALRLLTKAVRTATALRVDGDRRAWRHLRAAEHALSSGGDQTATARALIVGSPR